MNEQLRIMYSSMATAQELPGLAEFDLLFVVDDSHLP